MAGNSVTSPRAPGFLVDGEALADWRLRGAGLDVPREEPPRSGNRLLARQNVVLTPHSAALTRESQRGMNIASIQNALDGIDGKMRPEFVVKREVLSRPTS